MNRITFDRNLKNQTLLEIKNFESTVGMSVNKIPSIVHNSWKDIFTIADSKGNFEIGKTIFPKPQILAFILEALIAKEFESIDSNTWEFDPTGFSKDIVNKTNPKFSIEIKASSSKERIYGNRSYANPGSTSKKSKDSFYLAINFESYKQTKTPNVTKIRFGYLSHNDWRGQKSSSGQQSHLDIITERSKLLELWPKSDLEIK